MITVTWVQDDPVPRTVHDVGDISEIIKDPDAVLWVNVIKPTGDDLAILDREFDFHPLALSAAKVPEPRPKIDFYDTFIYFNCYVIRSEADDTTLQTQSVFFYVGSNYLVTIQDEPMQVIGHIRENWRQSTEEVGSRGVGLLLYAILDTLVDGYFEVTDVLSDQIEVLEDAIFDGDNKNELQQLFAVKKSVNALRRIATPERDVLNALIRWDSPVIDRHSTVYMQDVYDHLLRVIDTLDGYRDLISNILEAHLSVTSNRLNQTMKTLAASSIILMSMTLVASIYGMNFDRIPELSWRFGYWWALGLMTGIGFGLLYAFRKIDWI